jgi:hypothetical protein
MVLWAGTGKTAASLCAIAQRHAESIAKTRIEAAIVYEHTQHQSSDLAALFRELVAEYAPTRLSRHNLPNDDLRRRRLDMMRALARPCWETRAGFAYRALPRQRNGKRHT